MSILNLLASEEPNGVHLASDINEVIWGSLAFFVVAGLLVWKAGPVLATTMRQRTARIEAELAEAKAARAEAEAFLQASEAETPDVAAEEARIRAEAEVTAEQLKADLIARAEAEAEAVRERGRVDVANRRRQAQADLAAEVSRMTRTSAEAVVRDGLDSGAQSELIDSYISQVGSL